MFAESGIYLPTRYETCQTRQRRGRVEAKGSFVINQSLSLSLWLLVPGNETTLGMYNRSYRADGVQLSL